MLVYKIALIFCFFGSLQANHHENTESEVTKFMKFLQVIPDVITEGPNKFLKVTYDSGVFADKGIELKPAQVKNQPTVTWEPQPGAYYTLLLSDPDAPTRTAPKEREWNHWLVGNIPGNKVSKGEVLSAYIGAAPPEGSGLHRYVFLLYKQPKKLTFDEKRLSNTSPENRTNFSAQKFAKKYNLGNAIAGNFFQAQYDEYVPELYKQLGA